MLKAAHDEVKKHYYDPKQVGADWDERYQHYSANLAKARSLGEGYRIVAAYVSSLKDSHTAFIPPSRSTRIDSGFRYQIIGNGSFVTQIRPNTDAAEKLHIGDQIVQLDGYSVNRDDFRDLSYYYNILAPRLTEQLDLQSPSGETRHVVVNGISRANKKVLDLTDSMDMYKLVRQEENEEHSVRSIITERGDVAIWKLPNFEQDYEHVQKAIGIARKHKALVLDLRGDPGGYTDTLKMIVGLLFEQDVKIADQNFRKENKPMIAKHLSEPFTGKLVVLVDSNSASCAELLARVVQLQHRGTVIGDKSAGAVMEAMGHLESQGTDVKIFYEFEVTEANLIMTDGKSLEKTGVTPDEVMLPTGADLAAGRDVVLAHAVELAGFKLDPVEAGKLFPFEWTPLSD